MNSRPGTLKGTHIRRLPAPLLKKLGGVKGRYRVTGYRDSNGVWVSRVKLDEDGKRYGYRRLIDGRHYMAKPTDSELRRSPLVAVEIEITRRTGGPMVYYTTLQGPIG